MGIKVKWIVGGVLLVGTGIATVLGIRKKKGERSEKIDNMIQNVDLKKVPEKEEVEKEEKTKTAEEIIDECDKALDSMDLDEEDEKTQVTDAKADDVLMKGLLDNSEENRKKEQEMFENLAKIREEERQKRFESGEWMEEVEHAKAAKNFSMLEDLFNEKYNPYPYHPAPAGPFGSAHADGYIDDKLFAAAQKYYGHLWTYSGD